MKEVKSKDDNNSKATHFIVLYNFQQPLERESIEVEVSTYNTYMVTTATRSQVLDCKMRVGGGRKLEVEEQERRVEIGGDR